MIVINNFLIASHARAKENEVNAVLVIAFPVTLAQCVQKHSIEMMEHIVFKI